MSLQQVVVFCRSNIRDHWSQILVTNRITVEKFEIKENYHNVTETWNELTLLEK